jgi:hypothetical protein
MRGAPSQGDSRYRDPVSAANHKFVGRTALALGLLVGLGLTAGCVRPQVNEVDFDPTPPAPHEPTVTRDVTIGDDDDSDESDESGASADAPPPPQSRPKVLVWSPIRLGPREPVLFRLGAGLGALGHIDLNPCRDQGLPSGYVHMHLTFRGTGRVVRAAVETPMAPPPEALACIGDQIQATMVPVFDGGDVNLSKSVFVN